MLLQVARICAQQASRASQSSTRPALAAKPGQHGPAAQLGGSASKRSSPQESPRDGALFFSGLLRRVGGPPRKNFRVLIVLFQDYVLIGGPEAPRRKFLAFSLFYSNTYIFFARAWNKTAQHIPRSVLLHARAKNSLPFMKLEALRRKTQKNLVVNFFTTSFELAS